MEKAVREQLTKLSKGVVLMLFKTITSTDTVGSEIEENIQLTYSPSQNRIQLELSYEDLEEDASYYMEDYIKLTKEDALKLIESLQELVKEMEEE
ncbi:hypothetical protein EC55P1_00087 [Enterococcus phage EC55P1]|nr:hypothetical protein EC55P1_00087 [Enterococcus phage EC55P1]